VLRFVSNFAVPFSNNLAEQNIRMMKVKMKISGCFRTKAGAETFAILRSVISTARKQGWNILKTLSSPTKTLIANITGKKIGLEVTLHRIQKGFLRVRHPVQAARSIRARAAGGRWHTHQGGQQQGPELHDGIAAKIR
jgi:transposase